MKVGIFTLYSAFNYGAFLQAYATQEKIRSLGHDVVVVDFEPLFARRARYRTLVSRRPSTLTFNFAKFLAFRKAWEQLHIERMLPDRRYDLAVLGSDEIWNVRNPTFQPLPQYFGLDINSRVIASYAPSSSDSTLQEVQAKEFAVRGLSRLSNVSVRDERTYEIAAALTGRVPTLVLDPTFLLDWSRFKGAPVLKNYLLVYTYGLAPEQIADVQAFARSNQLTTVSPGFNNSWCDHVLPADPFAFLSLMANASYVVTDTFHGTIFSILYGRQFMSFAAKKPKIQHLLKLFGLEGRAVNGSNTIGQKLLQDIDYPSVGERRLSLQKASEEYVDSILLSAATAAP